MENTRTPSLVQALIPIIFLVILLGFNVWFFQSDSSYGANQIALLLAAGVAALIGLRLRVSWKDSLTGMIDSISSSMSAIIILLLIGALAGTWLISGVVPAMIYYGLQVLNPTIFLFATCIICAVVSLATGSSWSTVATVGIALLAIGQALGIGVGWSAGAIISGAYFGDKMSPLSDTTNLAPAVAGTDLFTHIKHMFWTTGPSILISLTIFLIAGFTFSGTADQNQIDGLLEIIDGRFNIHFGLFVVPLIVIALIYFRLPPIPALLVGSLLGAICAIGFQKEVVNDLYQKFSGIETVDEMADVSYAEQAYVVTINTFANTTKFEEENEAVNDLFKVEKDNRSDLLKGNGMAGMLNTVWLIICALAFGGAMQAAGMLQRITRSVLKGVNSVGSLIAATTGTCIFFNITASDQYLAIVVPGRMFSDAYKDQGLAPENLSRTLEDSGTVTSVLIPWNTCGVAQSGVLGVDVLTYAFYAFFNWISPLMTMLFGFMGWKIAPLKTETAEESE
jgi:NhaC family Na+:H+ antiporter